MKLRGDVASRATGHGPATRTGASLRSGDPDARVLGVVLPLAFAAVLLVLDVLTGPRVEFEGLVAAAPFLAAALTSSARTALVGLTVVAGVVLTGFLQEDAPGVLTAFTSAQHVRVGVVAAMAVTAVLVAAQRSRRARAMKRLASVASAAQDAILRPLPPVVGSVRCAATYLSATEQANIGGDLIEALDTRHGVRLLVGDVRGKGMGALRLAGLVLGAFREHAWTAADLPTLAGTLDSAVRRDAGPEDFVTAALVEVHDDGTVLVVSCGHPAPFVAGPGPGRRPAVELEVEPSPPLGLLDSLPAVTATELEDNQRLVLVTDGLLEARRPKRWLDRRSGEFLPAAEVLGLMLSRGPLEPALADVVEAVRDWSRGRLGDDLAVLAVEHRGRTRVPPTPRSGEDSFFDVERYPLADSA